MAALAIPIISAAAPLLMPLITSLIQHVEGLFGPKTGATKFTAVLDAVLPVATQLATAGKIPGTLDPASIAVMIETLVQNLKAQGLLNGTAPAVPQIPAVIQGAPLALGSITGTYNVSIRPA